MVVQRRMMLGGMRDPTATIVAIVVNGLEEALVRCTMVYRDDFWDWVCERPKPTEAEIRAKRLVQAASTATGMRIEVTSIISCRLVLERRLLMASASHRKHCVLQACTCDSRLSIQIFAFAHRTSLQHLSSYIFLPFYSLHTTLYTNQPPLLHARRMAYFVMRPHRFAFNFGYGFDANDDAMASAAFLFVSMFLELGMEVAIDSAALGIEEMHGIDVDKFWDMWQVNPGNFFGLHLSCSMMALSMAFWSFSTLPTPIFCTSPHNPCSCSGGGFQIFKSFCAAAAAAAEATKKLASNTTNSTEDGIFSAIPKNAYVL